MTGSTRDRERRDGERALNHSTSERDRDATRARSRRGSIVDRAGGNGAVQLRLAGGPDERAATDGRASEREGPTIQSSGGREAIRPKLSVNEPNDRFEREAERVADVVVENAEGAIEESPVADERLRSTARPGAIGASGSRESAPRSVHGGRADRIQSIRGDGHPMPKSVRSFFESRFGRDFGDVRVHSNAEADDAARAIDARAFTSGRDVVFRDGEYRPGTASGRRLLAHELTHVLQQRRAGQSVAGVVQRQEDDEPSGSDEKSKYRRRLEERRSRTRLSEYPLDPKKLDQNGPFTVELLLHISYVSHELGSTQTGPLILDVLEQSPKFLEMASDLNEYYGRDDTPGITIGISSEGKSRFEPRGVQSGIDSYDDLILIGGDLNVDPETEAVETAQTIIHETAHAYRQRVEGTEADTLSEHIADEKQTRELEIESLKQARSGLQKASGEQAEALASELGTQLNDPPSTTSREVRLDIVSGTRLTYAEHYYLDGVIETARESMDAHWKRLRALDSSFGLGRLNSLAAEESGRSKLRSAIERHAPRSVTVSESAGAAGGGTAGTAGGSSVKATAEHRGKGRATRARSVATDIARDETPLSRREYRHIQRLLGDEGQTLRSLETATPPERFSAAAKALYRYVRLYRMTEIRERIEAERERSNHARGDDEYVEQAIRFAKEYLGRPRLYSK